MAGTETAIVTGASPRYVTGEVLRVDAGAHLGR